MRNAEYWERRFEAIEQMATETGESAIRSMERHFANAQRDLQNQISGWYTRFATNNEIDLADARRLLNSNELAEFRWSVEEYIDFAKQNTVSGQWVRQLENASARVHISRLEALQIQTQSTMERLFGNQLDSVDSILKRQFLDNYHHTMFEIQSGLNVGWDIAGINESQLQALLNKPWTLDGRTFSDRIWTDKQRLVNELHKELSQGLIIGTPPNVIIDNLAASMNTSKSNAARLVMTESAALAATARKKSYRETGVEMVKIIATLDKKTSKICRKMDGKIVRMDEYEVGVTVPPFHPWCRSTTAPYFDDEFSHLFEGGERAARDKNGKTYYVPSDMKYPEWKETFVDKGSKSDIMDVGKNESGEAMPILPNHDKAIIPIEKFTKYALDTEHDDGKHKALVFRTVLGYTMNDAAKLVSSIKNNISKYPATFKRHNGWGNEYEVIMDIEGLTGRIAPVVTAWIIKDNEDFPRLTSAYIDEQ